MSSSWLRLFSISSISCPAWGSVNSFQNSWICCTNIFLLIRYLEWGEAFSAKFCWTFWKSWSFLLRLRIDKRLGEPTARERIQPQLTLVWSSCSDHGEQQHHREYPVALLQSEKMSEIWRSYLCDLKHFYKWKGWFFATILRKSRFHREYPVDFQWRILTPENNSSCFRGAADTQHWVLFPCGVRSWLDRQGTRQPQGCSKDSKYSTGTVQPEVNEGTVLSGS